jgi:hypothetical protein
MTNIRTIINNELAKGNDVIITDGSITMERMYGGCWTVVGEWGWNSTEEEVDQMEVVKVEIYEEGVTEITVKSTNWG